MPAPIHRLRPEQFPFTVEAFHPQTGKVVWSATVEAPEGCQLAPLKIPALKRMFGHPVAIRIRFADGTVEEGNPSGV